MIVAIVVGVSTVLLMHGSDSEAEEIPFTYTLVNSTYNFPNWNTTFKTVNNSLAIYGLQLFRDATGGKISEETWDSFYFGDNELFHLNNILSDPVPSGENFTLYLWFVGEKYMKTTLVLPPESW